jgi:hypothetical protein
MQQLCLFEEEKVIRVVDESHKRCIKCLEIVPITKFGHSSNKHSGRCNTCNPCKRKHEKIRERLKLLYPTPKEAECPICKTFTDDLVVDHVHDSNEFRGHICDRCNIALGIFKDDMNILKNAVDYLSKSI